MINGIPEGVLYLPGQEPPKLKGRLQRFFAKLDTAYPDKVVVGLQKDHKKWAETLTELYRLLGYPNGNALLEAYGYNVEIQRAGRKAQTNVDEFFAELKLRYPNGSECKTITELIEANPDLKGDFVFLSKNSISLFGKTALELLREMRILLERFQETSDSNLGKDSLDALLRELKARYPDGFCGSLKELLAENEDLKIINYYRIIKVYCKKTPMLLFEEEGILRKKEASKKNAEVILRELKSRYPDGFYGSLLELERENKNLFPPTYKFIIKETYGKTPKVVFEENGILRKKERETIDYENYEGPGFHIMSFSDFTFEDLVGKNVVLNQVYQSPLISLLTSLGVNVKTHMSSLVEYIACGNIDIPPTCKHYIQIIEALKNKKPEDGFPKVIDANKLYSSAEKYRRQIYRDKYKDETFEQKLERAKRIFHKCVMEIHLAMDKTKTYNDPMVGDCGGRFKRDNKTEVCEKGVDLFFDYVVEHYKTYNITDLCSNDPAVLRKNLDSAFREVLLGGDLSEYIGVRLPVAVAIALFVFVDASYSPSMNFVRDKWEARGDYNYRNRVYFQLSAEDEEEEGWVHYGKDANDKKKRPYATKCQDVSPTDLNGKTVLILCGDLKSEATKLAKKLGATVRQEISDETDDIINYIITTEKIIKPENKIEKRVISYMKNIKNGIQAPVFVDYFKLRDEQ